MPVRTKSSWARFLRRCLLDFDQSWRTHLVYVAHDVRRRNELSGAYRSSPHRRLTSVDGRHQEQQLRRRYDTTYPVQPSPESGGTAWQSSSSELIPISRASPTSNSHMQRGSRLVHQPGQAGQKSEDDEPRFTEYVAGLLAWWPRRPTPAPQRFRQLSGIHEACSARWSHSRS